MRLVGSLCAAALVVGCGQVKDAAIDAATPGDGNGGAVDAAIDGAIDAPPDAPPDAALGIPPGAAMWLRFDDAPGDGVLDSSATPHTVTCVQCPTLVTGLHGNAYEFTNDRVDVAVASDLLAGTAFTVAAWVRLASTPAGGNTVLLCKAQSGNDCSYALLPNSATRIAYHSAGSGQTAGTALLPVGTWHHVAMTWNGTTRLGYVDGVLDSTLATTTMGTEASILSIGERNDASALSLPGAIDDVVFYRRVLTAQELTQLATP